MAIEFVLYANEDVSHQNVRKWKFGIHCPLVWCCFLYRTENDAIDALRTFQKYATDIVFNLQGNCRNEVSNRSCVAKF